MRHQHNDEIHGNPPMENGRIDTDTLFRRVMEEIYAEVKSCSDPVTADRLEFREGEGTLSGTSVAKLELERGMLLYLRLLKWAVEAKALLELLERGVLARPHNVLKAGLRHVLKESYSDKEGKQFIAYITESGFALRHPRTAETLSDRIREVHSPKQAADVEKTQPRKNKTPPRKSKAAYREINMLREEAMEEYFEDEEDGSEYEDYGDHFYECEEDEDDETE